MTIRTGASAALLAMLTFVAFTAVAEDSEQKLAEAKQLIIDHIAEIKEPRNFATLIVKTSDGLQLRRQRVEVIGKIPQDTLQELVQLALADDTRYSVNADAEWEVKVTADMKYANVRVEYRCESLCGYGTSTTYAFERGVWLLKFADRWME